jgi:hypothetical protein
VKLRRIDGRSERSYSVPMSKEEFKGAVMLSKYPAAKIIVECDKCGLRVQYDQLEMLEVGGDRPLPDLLSAIARRNGCDKFDRNQMYDWCKAQYANLVPAKNSYAKAKGL